MGKVVEIPLNYDLVPTTNPLVWEYRPGFPPEMISPVLVVEFLPGQVPSRMITGRVSAVVMDTLTRPSGFHFYAVISSATASVSTSRSPR